MDFSTVYNRYRLDDGRYWGSTDDLNDMPECGYTEVEPPEFWHYLEEIPCWTGTDWIIKPLIDGHVEP